MIRRLGLALLVSAFILAPALAGECISYATGPQVVGQLGVDLDDAAVSGDVLFGVNENGLNALDVSDPASPALIGAVSFGISGGKVAVGGSIVWSVDGDVLRGIDVSTPAAPFLVHVEILSDLVDVQLDGTRLIVISNSELRVFDVADPSNPVDLGAVTGPSSVFRGLAVADGYAYVGYDPFPSSPRILHVYDVAAAPTFVTSLDLGFATDQFFDQFAVGDDRLYVSSVRWSDPCIYGRPIQVVDISVPSAPAVIDAFDAYDASHLAVRNGRLEVYDYATLDVLETTFGAVKAEARLSSAVRWSAEAKGYVITNGGVVAGTGSDSPVPLGTLPGLDEKGLDFVHRDAFIYVLGSPFSTQGSTCGNSGSTVYALDTTGFGFILEAEWNALGGDGRHMFAEGDRLFTAGGFFSGHSAQRGGTFAVYDLTTHPAPELGRYSLDDEELFDAAVSGTTAYLLIESPIASSLRVLDITDPAAMVEVADLPISPGSVLQRVGDALYLGRSGATDIYDISTPAAPVLVGSHPYPARGVLDGTTMYTQGEELRRLDVSDPFAPVSLGVADVAAPGRVSLDDGIVYWSSSDGVTLLDAATFAVEDGKLPVLGPVTFIDEGILAYAFEELRVYPPSCGAAVAVGEPATSVSIAVKAVPNPLRSHTTISFGGHMQGGVNAITIVDVGGRLVRRLDVRPDSPVEWDATDERGRRVGPGVYYYRLHVDGRERLNGAESRRFRPLVVAP